MIASATCFSSWSHSRMRLKVSAHSIPASTPMSIDPTKITMKVTIAPPMRAEVESPSPSSSTCAAVLKASTVRASTMATASLSTLSPNTMAKMLSRTPMALKTASTVTGSVAEMREPKKSAASLVRG